MTIIRIGATKKYSDGWENAFGKGKKKPAAVEAVAAKPAKKSAGKKAAAPAPKKAAGKKAKK